MSARREAKHGGPRTRVVLPWLFSILLLAYGVFLAWGSRTGYPDASVYSGHMPYLVDKPVGEDGFYMLTVAHNIATRGRILYNGDLQTTGIQPLATFVFAGIDRLVLWCGGGPVAFVRWVLLFGVALSILFAWLVGRTAERLAPPAWRASAFPIGFLLALLNYTLFRLFTYGLETGVYLVFLALCFLVTVTIAERGRASLRDVLLLGVTGGLSGLARIDFGLLFAVLLAGLLLSRLIRWTDAVLSGAVAVVLVSPWFLYLHRVTGAWIPSSGRAESRLINAAEAGTRVKVIVLATLAQLAPWSFGGMTLLTTVVTVVSAAAVVWLWFSAPGRAVRAESPVAFKLAKLWAPGFVVIAIVYVLLFFSTHFYHRYMAPLAVLTMPLLALLFCALPPLRQRVGAVAVVLGLFFTVWTAASLHTGRIGNTQTIATGYLLKYYPGVHAGAFQSGIMGFADPDVENLDGKLNMEAWQAEKDGRMPEFIDHEGIQVLVDWPSVIGFFLPRQYLDAEWQPCPVPLEGTESKCLVRRPGTGRTSAGGAVIAAPNASAPTGR